MVNQYSNLIFMERIIAAVVSPPARLRTLDIICVCCKLLQLTGSWPAIKALFHPSLIKQTHKAIVKRTNLEKFCIRDIQKGPLSGSCAECCSYSYKSGPFMFNQRPGPYLWTRLKVNKSVCTVF